jgi:hypothetical protein
MTPPMRYPFDVPPSEIEAGVDVFVDAVFGTLQSSFLLLPRGPGFVTYHDFQGAYEVLKHHTAGFSIVEPENVMAALLEDALAFVVLRTMLGFSPPELAYVTSRMSEAVISQNFARTIDRRVRVERHLLQSLTPKSRARGCTGRHGLQVATGRHTGGAR